MDFLKRQIVGVMESIVRLKLTNDRGVDTASIESIVADATRGAVTSEQRVLALFHWYRRMIYHHRSADADRNRRDVLKAINSLGYNLCGSQTAVFVTLLRHAGFKTRVVAGSARGDFGGHTFCEVWFDGHWHCFDTMTSFFVYTRGTPRRIASLEDLRADPSLVARAVAENRAPPAFLCCTYHQESSPADKAVLARTMGEADLTWSTLLFTAGSLVDFWSSAPGASRVLDEEGTYGGRYTPDLMDLTLHPQEILVWSWDNPGLWIRDLSHPDFGPHHTCGAADEHDPVNFKYFEPYLRENFGHARRCYRRHSNGSREWWPDESLPASAGVRQANLRVADGRGTLASDGTAPAEFILPLRSPYAVLQIEVDLELEQGADARTVVSLRDREKPDAAWAPIMTCDGACRGLQTVVFTCMAAPLYVYDLKVSAGRAPARFRIGRLKTVFQLNPAALPTLYPGDNTIRISADTPTTLRRHCLRVACEWDDGPGWNTRRQDVQVIRHLPHTYHLRADVSADKMPRMKQITLALRP